MIIVETEDFILRDMIESDIEARIRWETVEKEWQLWDGPWEYEGKSEEELKAELDCYIDRLRNTVQRCAALSEDTVRDSFQIETKKDHRYIGWINTYDIDDDYNPKDGERKTAIGIDIPEVCSRGQGIGCRALQSAIQYLKESGVEEIYTQTWSGNERMIHVAEKLGFTLVRRKKGIRMVRGKRYDGLTFRLQL